MGVAIRILQPLPNGSMEHTFLFAAMMVANAAMCLAPNSPTHFLRSTDFQFLNALAAWHCLSSYAGRKNSKIHAALLARPLFRIGRGSTSKFVLALIQTF